MTAIHEDLRREHEVRPGSERVFGLVIAAAVLVYALAPLRAGHGYRGWAVGVAAGFAFAALAFPPVLRPLNAAWLKLGLAISRVMQPIIMAAVFVLVFVPFGLLMRALGKTTLRLARGADVPSYWIPRARPSNPMSRQF
jgi:hypothetical protein